MPKRSDARDPQQDKFGKCLRKSSIRRTCSDATIDVKLRNAAGVQFLYRSTKFLRYLVATVWSSSLVASVLSAPTTAAPAQAQPGEISAVRNSVIAAIASSGCGFAGRREYCMTDVDMIDAIVQRLIDRHFAGHVPPERERRAELVAYAHTDAIGVMRSATGLRWLEARMRERFERPVVAAQSGRTVVDVGFVPGTLVVGPRSRIVVASSSHLERGQWRSAEAAKLLASYATELPHVPVIDVIALVADGHDTRWTYRFERATGRVLVFNDTMPTGAYVTEGRVDAALTDFVAGRRSLATDQLRWLRGARIVR